MAPSNLWPNRSHHVCIRRPDRLHSLQARCMLMPLSASWDGGRPPLRALDLHVQLMVVLEVCLDADAQECACVSHACSSVVSGTSGFTGLTAGCDRVCQPGVKLTNCLAWVLQLLYSGGSGNKVDKYT